MLDSQVHAREVSNRLRNPLNGRQSSELEITSGITFRRRLREERHEQHKLALVEAEQQRADAINQAITNAAAKAKREAVEQGKAPRRPAVAQILNAVCRRYNMTELDIRCQRRTADIVLPRHVVMYLCKTLTELSLPQIGSRLGNRDHTTVLSGAKKIARLIQDDMHLAAEIEDIKRTLGVE